MIKCLLMRDVHLWGVSTHRKCSYKRKFNYSVVRNYVAYFVSLLQSTPESLFVHHAQMNLLPSHTYSNNSGGDPLCIPDLTVSARINGSICFWHLNLHNAWCKLLLMVLVTVVHVNQKSVNQSIKTGLKSSHKAL